MSNKKTFFVKFTMLSYADIQSKYYSGVHPDKIIGSRFSPKDYSVERALSLFNGTKESINTLRFAIRCVKNKEDVARAFEKKAMDPDVIPHIYGYTLKLRGEFDYDTVLSLYLESKGGQKERFAIYNFIRDSENPEETRSRFISDGVEEKHMFYFTTPKEIQDEINKNGIETLIKLHKKNYPKLGVAIYDYFKGLTTGRIKAFQTLRAAGIPSCVINQPDIAKLVNGKLTYRDLRILYNFKADCFEESLAYVIENYFGYGEKDVLSLLNRLTRVGIDKETLLSGKLP